MTACRHGQNDQTCRMCVPRRDDPTQQRRRSATFKRVANAEIRSATVPYDKLPPAERNRSGGEAMFESTTGISLVGVGSIMEDTLNYIKDVNAEVAESKKTLETLANDVRKLGGVILPALKEQIDALRTARMTAISEVRDSLKALGDVRRFFLEDDYKLEVERLERLVRVCRDVHELKTLGVLDAICDSALRLAVLR